MFCIYCGKVIDDDSKFCIFCGARVSEREEEYRDQNEEQKSELDLITDEVRNTVKEVRQDAENLLRRVVDHEKNRKKDIELCCTKCGKMLEVDSDFCVFCGTPVIENGNEYHSQKENSIYESNQIIKEEQEQTIEDESLVYEEEENYCPNCGKAIIADSDFCVFCGTPVNNTEDDSRLRKEGNLEPRKINKGRYISSKNHNLEGSYQNKTRQFNGKKLIVSGIIIGVFSILIITVLIIIVLRKSSDETEYSNIASSETETTDYLGNIPQNNNKYVENEDENTIDNTESIIDESNNDTDNTYDMSEPATENRVETRIGVADIEATSYLDVKTKDNSTFQVENTVDGDLSTAWIEGVDGVGEAQRITLKFDKEYDISKLIIFGGFLKNQYRYSINGKPTSICLYYNGERSLHEMKILEASDEEEPFVDPEGTTIILDSPVHTDRIDVEIIKAIAGEKYEDTAISEIEVYALLSADEVETEKDKVNNDIDKSSVIKAYQEYINRKFYKENGPVKIALCYIDNDGIPEAVIEQDGDIEMDVVKIVDGKAILLNVCLNFFYKPRTNDILETGGDGESAEYAKYKINGNTIQFLDGVGWYTDFYETGTEDKMYTKVIDNGHYIDRSTPITEDDFNEFISDMNAYSEISFNDMFDSVEEAVENLK